MIGIDRHGPGAARVRAAAAFSCFLTLVACGGGRPLAEEAVGAHPRLPAPAAAWLPTTRFSTATPWPAGASPRAPSGFTVMRLAEGLSHPRWLHVLPNGDVLVAESMTLPAEPNGLAERIGFYLARVDGSRGQSADTIVLLRDADGDGVVERRSVFLRGTVKQPFGMALIGDRLYVAGTGGVWQYTYRDGDPELSGEGRNILDLPVGGYNHHWTRNILAREDGQKLYVTVGSVSDFGEGDADTRWCGCASRMACRWASRWTSSRSSCPMRHQASLWPASRAGSGQERESAGGRRHGWHHLAGVAGSDCRRVEMTRRPVQGRRPGSISG